MTQNVKRPARLDIVDMPRDTTRALGGLRQALCASFNYCRKYPAKMAVLKEVLKYTYNRIVQWEKEYAVQQKVYEQEALQQKIAKEKADQEASEQAATVNTDKDEQVVASSEKSPE